MLPDEPTDPSMSHGQLLAEYFVQRFAPSYWYLLYYAALPLWLTPELLNYLHSQFLRSQRVPWEAQADLLLSNLCNPVGYEQFELAPEVRAYLLQRMEQQIGHQPMQDAAHILVRYVQYLAHTGSPINRRQLREQQWSAMLMIDQQRSQAVEAIQEAFRQSRSPAEVLRLAELTRMHAPYLKAFPDFLRYAEEVSRQLRGPGFLEPILPESANHLNLPTTDDILQLQPDPAVALRGLQQLITLAPPAAWSELQRLVGQAKEIVGQLQLLRNLAELSELLNRLESECYSGIVQERAKFPDPLSLDNLTDYTRILGQITSSARPLFRRIASFTSQFNGLDTTSQAYQALVVAVEQQELRELRSCIALLEELLLAGPAEIIGLLATTKPSIPDLAQKLRRLVQATPELRGKGTLDSGLAMLEQLGVQLHEEIGVLEQWQQADLLLRQVKHLPRDEAFLARLQSLSRHVPVEPILPLNHSQLRQTKAAFQQALATNLHHDVTEAIWYFDNLVSVYLLQAQRHVIDSTTDLERSCSLLGALAEGS